jgi:hypothetical protein
MVRSHAVGGSFLGYGDSSGGAMNMQETVQAEVLEQVARTGAVDSNAICCRVVGCDCRDVLRAVELLMAQGTIELRDLPGQFPAWSTTVQLRVPSDEGRRGRSL